MSTVGFIGASKTGTVLARYFQARGITISGFYSANPKALDETIRFAQFQPFSDINTLVKSSDIIFITTKDCDIKEQWRSIDHQLMVGKAVFHCSGALSSTILLSTIKNIAKGSIHPITSIPSKTMDVRLFEDITFAIEGDKLALKQIQKLLNITQNKSIILKRTHKIDYHIACVAMTSFYISLYTFADKLLKNCVVDENVDRTSLILNLSKVVMQNIAESSNIKDVITGPLIRGDYQVLEQHINSLSALDKKLYQILSENLLKVLTKSIDQNKILKTLGIGEFDVYN